MSVIDNLKLYNTKHVVAYYEMLTGLQPVEEYVFGKYVPTGANVVDVGVGGGRTTQWLSSRAGRYLGIDYAQAMVDGCRARFPGLTFQCSDATDLSSIADATFDVAIFSFNGIDYIPSNAGRVRCLSELRRVIKSDGVVIISSHNAKLLAQYPDLNGAGLMRKSWRILRAVGRSPMFLLRAVRSRAFYENCGYITDPVHGGLHTHVSTPASIARDARDAGLAIAETVGGYYPKRVSRYLTNWYYYVLVPAGLGE